MATLPRQLQRQADEVAQIEKDIADRATPPTAEAPPPETPPQQDGQDNVPPPPPPPQAPVAPPSDWEQRYRTLEGKYKAEVPRLHNQMKELQTKFEALAAKPPEPPKMPETPTQKKRLVTDKDAETFGPDLLDLIKRQAQDIADEMVGARESKLMEAMQKLQAENASLMEKVTGVTQTQSQSAQEMYLAKLGQVLPEWEQINTDQRFLNWLGEIDPLSGLTRQAYLDNAFQALDVQRTANLFRAWLSTIAPPTPAQPPAEQRSEVQRQVTPGKSKTTATVPQEDNSRIWTSQGIAKFYDSLRAGRVKRDDAARIEKEIDLAVSTGRVR